MVQIKCDLHIHTIASADGHCTVKDIISKAKEAGFNAIAITDHDTTKSSKEAVALSDENLTIIPGVEVSTKQGHVLVLGTTDEFPMNEEVETTIAKAKEKGCLVIIPHPFHRFRHAVGLKNMNALKKADAIEAYNSRYYVSSSNKKAARVAKKFGKPITAGSDAHSCRFVGYGINLIEAEDNSVASILKAVKEGKIESRCIKTPARTYTGQSFGNVMRKIKRRIRRR